MDVNLTISLMRGQMGVVIEKAVNAAVETVLGEMIRVVSVKFEEFRREMTAKERENENIRNMLEMSRCQMKSMRKYVNALTAKAKHDRQTFTNHRHTLTQFDASSTRHVGVSHARDVAPALGTQPRRTSANVGAACEAQSPVPKPRNAETGLADEPAWENQINVPKSQNVIQEPIPNESYTSPEIGNEDQVSKMHLGSVKETANATVMGSRGLVAESSDPLWGQTPPSSSEVEHTDPLDSSLLPAANPREIFSTTAADCEGSPFKVKQEEAEVEIVQVKEEPAEVVNSSSSDCPRLELSQHAAEGGPSFSLELPVTQQCHQISCPPISEAAFMSVDPITYGESQLAMASSQRQGCVWAKDLNMYEEYKRKRTEVRRRSETRRRELEQTLPQALLADLVKERREKTRLRVARWRAKRKLQACLMSQAAQLSGPPVQTLCAQPTVRRQGGVATQQGSFSLGRAQGDAGPSSLPLQVGSGPLLVAQRLSMAEGQMQPGSSTFP
ncbi:uncharacterized protein si:ch211-67e16.4 isoform X2 [Electrophorus electricus]|uniref:uncharacterized protein si:ch211-67e16.4 isoform X2 n=1 Tax=Electrophorus electricus TaxID=8005 RepID=UPI0015CF906A|nr:uncharacterized protein si:ch211-67e16.4 isoform X2 [Electrophorus electricus]